MKAVTASARIRSYQLIARKARTVSLLKRELGLGSAGSETPATTGYLDAGTENGDS